MSVCEGWSRIWTERMRTLTIIGRAPTPYTLWNSIKPKFEHFQATGDSNSDSPTLWIQPTCLKIQLFDVNNLPL